jgi:hypothetical protein
MTTPADRLKLLARRDACFACDRRRGAVTAAPTCGVTGQRLTAQIQAGNCPLGKWPDAPRDSTSVGASFVVPAGWQAADYRLDSKGSAGCGCK